MNLERWLVSYADFITLLFAFFVVMYAISQADLSKFKKVSESIRVAFKAAGPTAMMDLGGSSGGKSVRPFDEIYHPGGRVIDLPAGKSNTVYESDPELHEIRETLEESMTFALGVSDLSERLQMEYDSRGLIVKLSIKDLFEYKGVDIHPDMQPILDKVGQILARYHRLVRVEGHVDLREGKALGLKGSLEMSSSRAAWVIQFWNNRFGLDLKRFGVAGYGYARPLSEDLSEWSQMRNRRVEIVILNNTYSNP